MKILLFGKNGQVGWELHRSLLPLGEIIAMGREEADFANPESLRKIVQQLQPDVIVNAAAYTTVDKAENEEELAVKINSTAPGVLAEEAKSINALLVHYSTDYVFDGTKGSPYVETDQTNPVNVYGKTKLEGELAIRSSGCNFIILRTSWVYASRGNNFLKTIIRLSKDKNELQIIDDQYGTPSWSRYIADSTTHILFKKVTEGSLKNSKNTGVFHLANHGLCSWFQFSKEIISVMQSYETSVKTEVTAINSSQYNFIADRPKFTGLCADHIEKTFALHNIEWEKALSLCMAEVYCDTNTCV